MSLRTTLPRGRAAFAAAAVALTAFLASCDEPNSPTRSKAATGARYPTAPSQAIADATPQARLQSLSDGVWGRRVLLLNADGGQGPFLESQLVATGRFTTGDIDIMDLPSTPPSLATLQNYGCIIVWTNFAPPSPVANGDRLREYVDAGGGVVLAVYGYSSPNDPWEIQGGITNPGYSPFDLTTTRQFAFPRSLNFGTALTSHPILSGVADFTYGGNSNYVNLALDPGATLVASDNFGLPLIAVSASEKVAGINVYPGSYFSKSAGVFRAFANACISTGDGHANTAPVANAGPPQGGLEGGEITFDGSGSSDADEGDVLTYHWDFGDGATSDAGPVVTHVYDDNRDTPYTVTLTVSDGDESSAPSTTTATIVNVAPTATFSVPGGSINEGGSFVIELTDATDVSAADRLAGFTFTLDCDDGSGPAEGASRSCAAPDNATRTVSGTVTDKDGGVTPFSAEVTIVNVAPSVDAGDGATILSGEAFTLNGSFSDPGLSDFPWSFTIGWSDGSPTTGSVGVQGAISRSHTYLRAGTYTVTLSVTDKDNEAAADVTTVVVSRIPVAGPAGYEVINVEGVGHGMVTIEVLSTPTVDATTIVASIATLGNESGAETHVERRNNGTYMTSVQDVNGDGLMDISLKFRRDELRSTGDLVEGTEHLVLLADLADGRQVRGVYNVRTVPK